MGAALQDPDHVDEPTPRMFDALSGGRPYRDRLSIDRVMTILRQESPHAIDHDCLEALESLV